MQIKKDFSYKVIVIIAIVGLIFGLSGCTLQQKSDGETDNLFGQARKIFEKKEKSKEEKHEISRSKKKECDVNEVVQRIMDMVIDIIMVLRTNSRYNDVI